MSHRAALPATVLSFLLFALSLPAALVLDGELTAADWPMWRYDAGRGGASPEELPETLQLQWVLELPTPAPAWPSNQNKLSFDRLYEPVLVGKRLFVPSMIADKVSAYHTDSAEELWSFFCDGPVRFAPAAAAGRLYFTSDDGYLYCLDAEYGTLLWRVRGGPADKYVLGNDRLISTWAARGAPVVHDGKVYFGASIWPFMGVFVHALDAGTGESIWTNSGTGSNFLTQQHGSPAFAGVAPQGYFAVSGDRLVVAGGRTLPAVFKRDTGEFVHFNVGSRKMGSKGGGGYEITAGPDFYINRGRLYRMDNGHYVEPAEALIVTKYAVIGKDGDGVCGFTPKLVEMVKKDRKGKEVKKTGLKLSWKTPLEEKIDTIYIMSGSRIYGTNDKAEVIAVDLPRFDRGVSVSWRVKLPDKPLNMITGDGKLFISSDEGRIYCFGGEKTDATMPEPVELTLVARGAEWTYLDNGSKQDGKWRGANYDDSKWKSGPAPLGYGDPAPKTKVGFGKDDKKKHMVTYFRHRFDVPRETLTDPRIRVLVDDGAVVFLNGKEVGKQFMPDKFDHRTAAKGGTDEKTYYELELKDDVITPGPNVLAVQVHQASGTSSDLLFDLELVAKKTRRDNLIVLDPVPSTLASTILTRASGEGYCVALGLGSGELVEALASTSNYHVIVVDPDAERVDAFRRKLDKVGAYGTRVSALVADPLEVDLPPYMADLVVSEDPEGAGLAATSAFVRRAHHILRPYTGMGCFAMSRERFDAFASAAEAASFHGTSVTYEDGLAIVRRETAPKGSGEWTHQYADASNRVSSRDVAVKAPIGLLWFGGPSNEDVLPRHGHGPTPQVAGGRLVIEGRDMLRATDIYTGRLLWERELEDLGKYYDYTSHEPGANAIGSNYVTLADAIYVVYGNECLQLDPETGKTVKTFEAPRAEGEKDAPSLGFLAVLDDLLVLGARPSDASSPQFTSGNFKGIKDDAFAKSKRNLEVLKDFDFVSQGDKKNEDFLAENLNNLLYAEDMIAKIPSDVRKKAKAEEVEKKLREYLEKVPGRKPTDIDALVIKRELLHKYYGAPKHERKDPGKFNSMQLMASKALHVFDRHSGQELWQHEARNEMRHNAIAIGGGRVFFIDRVPKSRVDHMKRRGLEVDEMKRFAALDAKTGKELWSTGDDVFGTFVGYSLEHDIVIQAGAKGRDRAVDEIEKGIKAYDAATGRVLWKNEDKYSGPCVLVGDWVITQGYGEPGFALDIRTGEHRMRRHPVSGEKTKWGYIRNYGCNTAIGSPNLLTFRSAAAGYYDLLNDSGTGNFGGFRSGCTSNLIPAGGILNAPDYTRTCTCSYQNQASLGLIHMPEVEQWTFSAHRNDDKPVRRVGLNFGAPGDRLGDGTLWVDYPSVGGRSPDVRVEVLAKDPKYPRRHPSTISLAEKVEGDGVQRGAHPWVAASGFVGEGEIAVKLRTPQKVVVPNEVFGGAPIQTAVATLSAKVPGRTVTLTGSRNRSSLGHGPKPAKKDEKFEGRVSGYQGLAAESVTVEFYTHVDKDAYYIDARDAKKQSGFVLNHRELRARYFVTNKKGNGAEKQIELKSKEKIKDRTWVHVAFTYDAESGVGKLFLDGKEVASHKGEKNRALWWAGRTPDLSIGRDFGEHCAIDEIRIARAALGPKRFLRDEPTDGADPEEHIVGFWRMESNDADTSPGVYTVRLVFAELEDLEPGERRFDVSIQGKTLLENFDIIEAAGGPRRVITREFHNVRVVDHLRIALTKRGERLPLLNGVEVLKRSKSF